MNTPETRRCFFHKKERLCSKKIITELFEHGASFRVGVLKFFYLLEVDPAEQEVPVQVAFAVPKRSFKHAYLRNRLKRRMREAYRLHKHFLVEKTGHADKRIAIFVKLSSRKEVSYLTLEHAMKKGLRQMIKRSEGDFAPK